MYYDCRSYPRLEGLLDSLLLLYKIAWPLVVGPRGFVTTLPSDTNTHASVGQSHKVHTYDYTLILFWYRTAVPHALLTNRVVKCSQHLTHVRIQLGANLNHMQQMCNGAGTHWWLHIGLITLQVVATAVKVMGRKQAKEDAANLVDQVDRVQKKFDDGAPKGSQASFKTAASGSKR